MIRSRSKSIGLMCVAATLLQPVWAADPPATPASNTTVDVAKLKAQLDEQQKEIDKLRAMLEAQQKMLEQSSAVASAPAPERKSQSVGETASAVPMIVPTAAPAPSRSPMTLPDPLPARTATPQAASAPESAPLQLRIGDTTIQPIGFMDLTMSFKDKNAGGSLGSNFGSIPYNNAATAKLTELRFSPQNSRIGFRVDGNWKGAHFMGYNEFDFLGTSGAFNMSVTNGAFVPRLRLFWVDVRKDQFEFLAGQSWSMLTPNRKGISALPGDLFYSQVVDVNYVIGLPWTRQPGVRFLYHPNERVTFGLSLENPDQYIGGSGGGPSVVLPTALAGLSNTQLDNPSGTAGAVQNIPNVHPDIIAKLAFDPTSRVHFEVAGIERTFKVWNTTTGQPTSGQYSTKAVGGGAINGNFEVAKNFRLITNNLWGEGVGRYFFGNAPDLIVRADGTVSPMHSGGTVDGFEARVNNNKLLLYAYYGGLYIGRNVAFDANGTTLIGYGYRGSANSQNKTVQEGTFGFNQTLWADPKYGALNLMGQYQYLFRDPWYVAPNSPKGTHDNTIFINVRYTLPGSAPPVK
ncbi:MAG TPA: hypothetical protein VKU19_23630 [Bryobacteraceae bacterium]|nr:hypothetical protein [Bryobacteraceae bacterium]